MKLINKILQYIIISSRKSLAKYLQIQLKRDCYYSNLIWCYQNPVSDALVIFSKSLLGILNKGFFQNPC